MPSGATTCGASEAAALLYRPGGSGGPADSGSAVRHLLDHLLCRRRLPLLQELSSLIKPLAIQTHSFTTAAGDYYLSQPQILEDPAPPPEKPPRPLYRPRCRSFSSCCAPQAPGLAVEAARAT